MHRFSFFQLSPPDSPALKAPHPPSCSSRDLDTLVYSLVPLSSGHYAWNLTNWTWVSLGLFSAPPTPLLSKNDARLLSYLRAVLEGQSQTVGSLPDIWIRAGAYDSYLEQRKEVSAFSGTSRKSRGGRQESFLCWEGGQRARVRGVIHSCPSQAQDGCRIFPYLTVEGKGCSRRPPGKSDGKFAQRKTLMSKMKRNGRVTQPGRVYIISSQPRN